MKQLSIPSEYVDASLFTWTGKVGSAEFSSIGPLPNKFDVKSSKTGDVKTFVFKETVRNREEITHWDFVSGDLTIRIFND